MELEAWLRGPPPEIDPLLVPTAHALIQTREEVGRAVQHLEPVQIWARPGGAASIGFHLRHIAGVTDRLFTYARGEALSSGQLEYLAAEALPGDPPAGVDDLLRGLHRAVDAALAELATLEADDLLTPRGVGRGQIPSNVIGLLFHAGEHAQRHAGQIIATVAFLTEAARG